MLRPGLSGSSTSAACSLLSLGLFAVFSKAFRKTSHGQCRQAALTNEPVQGFVGRDRTSGWTTGSASIINFSRNRSSCSFLRVA